MLNRSNIMADIIGLEAQLQNLPIHERLKLFRKWCRVRLCSLPLLGRRGR